MPVHKEFIFNVSSVEELVKDLKLEFGKHLGKAMANKEAADKLKNERDKMIANAVVFALEDFAPVLINMVVKCPDASLPLTSTLQSQTVDGTGVPTATETTSDPISTGGALPKSEP